MESLTASIRRATSWVYLMKVHKDACERSINVHKDKDGTMHLTVHGLAADSWQ